MSAALSCGRTLGHAPRRCPARARPPAAVARLSPVSITARRPSALERADRLRRVGLDRIGEAEKPASGRRRRRRRPSARAARSASARAASWPAVDAAARQQRALPKRDLASLHAAAHALAGERLEALAPRARAPRAGGAATIAARQRVLAGPLERGRQPQQRRLRRQAGAGDDATQLAACLRSGCRSCRARWCRPAAGAPAPRRS